MKKTLSAEIALIVSLVFICFSFSASAKTPVKRTSGAAAGVVSKPAMRHLSVAEIEAKGIYPAMEALMYRMCIREVPFFLALHKCYYRSEMLDKGDSLMLKKAVIQSLLSGAAKLYSEKALTESPVTNIDSMMIFRHRGKSATSTSCNVIIYARPDAYEIPKTGARIRVPPKIKGTVVFNARTGAMTVTIFSPGVKLELPGYAKTLSLGLIEDMDIRYAELVPVDHGFEARLLYAVKEKDATKRGWTLNITECNKIRPYSR